MSDFPGHSQLSAVLTRARSELTKTVLTAATPRVINKTTGAAVSGGYGLTLPSSDLPEHWGSGRITSTHDEICPILPAYAFHDLDSDASILGETISPFTAADLRDPSDEDEDETLYGCGYMLVQVQDVPAGGVFAEGGIGSAAQLGWQVEVQFSIHVPAGRGVGQLNLYAGCLARVFSNAAKLLVGDSGGQDSLNFGDVPETAVIEGEDGGWLVGSWVAVAQREYFVPSNIFSYQ